MSSDMLDLKSESSRQSLRNAMETSERNLRVFWKRRKELLEKIVGDNWGSTERRATMLNVLWQVMDTYCHKLTVNRPRCLVVSQNPKAGHFANRFSMAINNYAKRIRFDDELAEIVSDALVGLGVCKSFWADSGNEIEVPNPEFPMEPGMMDSDAVWNEYLQKQHEIPQTLLIDPGIPMLERIPPEDFVYDTAMTRWKSVRYAAHRYRVSRELARKESRWDKSVREALRPTSKYGESFEERAEALSIREARHDFDELEEQVTVWDLYLPKEKIWAVMPDDPSLGPLFQMKWDGPPRGPFSTLVFGRVPDNLNPVSLIGNLDALHDTLNSLFNKAVDQAKRAKDVLAYTGVETDAKNVRDAEDGEIIRVGAPEALVAMKFGGVNPGNMQFATGVQNEFNKMSGNIELMAGIAPQSGTAKQDEMLNAASSAIEGKRIAQVADFVGDRFADLGWMLWSDPTVTVAGSRQVPGIDVTVDNSWGPDYRVGELENYAFDYEPFSHAYEGPEAKAQKLIQSVQVLAPLIPLGQAQGMTIDVRRLSEELAVLRNQPVLRDIVQFDPDVRELAMSGGGAAMPSAGKMGGQRQYEHVHTTANPVADRESGQWAEMASSQGGST